MIYMKSESDLCGISSFFVVTVKSGAKKKKKGENFMNSFQSNGPDNKIDLKELKE